MPTPSAKDGKSKPTASEFGALRSYLAKMGVSQAQIKAAIGTTVSGQTRGEIAAKLREFLKTL